MTSSIFNIYKRMVQEQPISAPPPNDLYSAIAKEFHGLTCAQNEVKTLHPELRQDVKRTLYIARFSANYGTM